MLIYMEAALVDAIDLTFRKNNEWWWWINFLSFPFYFSSAEQRAASKNYNTVDENNG